MGERKKIWSNIILFLLPIALVIAIVFIVPANERFNYYFPKFNCMGHSGWLYDRLHLIDTNSAIDVAFVGSSRTIDGVADNLLEDSLKKKGIDVNVLNFGYCRFGRNMHHMLVKRMLEQWKPKCVVIEVTAKENWDGHPDFGYMANNQELFAPVMIFNDNYIEDIKNGFVTRFDAIRSDLFGVDELPPVQNDWKYGHMSDTTHVDPEILRKQQQKWQTIKRTTGFARWFYYQYPLTYLEKTIKLLQQNDCKVVFLYLPAYGAWDKPQEYDWYKKRGIVLIPPKNMYENQYYWKDGNHMNDYGAENMSYWLAGELSAIIQ